MEQITGGGLGKKVCVTGGSGFIASWLVKLLLERGYTVNATVRNPNDRTKTEHLLALDGAEERLHLFGAHLMEEGSFDSAIHGCDGVFHVASPVIIVSQNVQEEVIDPAVKGTLNVLASCAKTSSVKRVILTSSTAAIENNDRPLTNETIVDETWFSTLEGCKGKGGECYLMAKTLSEEGAWKFAKENGIDMVSINPAAVLGPLLQPTINTTTYFIKLDQWIGKLSKFMFWVGSRKRCCLADAHIRAFEIPSAKGRYIMSETVAHFADIVKILHQLYPTLKLPTRCEDDQPLKATHKISSDKVKSLGIEYIPLKTALKETVECLKEKFKISV